MQWTVGHKDGKFEIAVPQQQLWPRRERDEIGEWVLGRPSSFSERIIDLCYSGKLPDGNSHFKKSHHRGNKKWKKNLSERSEAGPKALQSMALDPKQLCNFGNKIS